MRKFYEQKTIFRTDIPSSAYGADNLRVHLHDCLQSRARNRTAGARSLGYKRYAVYNGYCVFVLVIMCKGEDVMKQAELIQKGYVYNAPFWYHPATNAVLWLNPLDADSIIIPS